MSREIINTGGNKRIVREIPKSKETKENSGSFEDLPEEKQNEILDKITEEHEKKHSHSKLKSYFYSLYDPIYDWLKSREHNSYSYKHRLGYVLTTLFLFALSIVGLILFYTNVDKLNSISLWIFKLAGVLLLISLFFAIKYGYRLIKEIINWLKRQRNWLRYLIILLLILFLWQTYTQRETALDPLFNFYEKTNFSYFNPVIIGSTNNLNYDKSESSPSVSQLWDDIKQEVDPTSLKSVKDTFEKLNALRSEKGLRRLSWDDRAYNMAVARSKDMSDRDYFSHLTPEGECMQTLKSIYGFRSGETVAENIWMISGGIADPNEALNSWIGSPGHYANLFYEDHVSGAIGCYSLYCVFNGINNDPYGLGAAPCSMYD